AIAGGAWKIVAADVAARTGTGPRLVSALVGLVTMVSADLLLIPAAGLRGAAIGAALGYSVALVTVVRSWHVQTRSSVLDLVGVRMADFEMLRRPSPPVQAIKADA
ncbi:MAG: hypothetical protein ABIP21_11080, partial [Acidimicrobiia bacterium]